MRKWKACLMASIAFGTFGLAESANAQTRPLYGGGATFPSKVYRLIEDCWGLQVDGNPPAGGPTGFIPALAKDAACPAFDQSALNAQMLYSAVGSGGGKRAFANGDCSSSGTTGLGTPAAANTIPFVSTQFPGYGYPKCHFAGSDDPVIKGDLDLFASSGTQARAKNWLQIPALLGPVTVAFNATGLAVPAGGLNLSRKAVCGIFSGHIQNWNNSIISATNGGPVSAGQQITVVHRSDGSGTTFIYTNALVAQCASEFGPNSETDATVVSYAFPWKDNNNVAGSLVPSHCNTPPTPNALPIRGSNLVGWPDASPDICGNTIPVTAGAVFANGSGNGGVVAKVTATTGAIGYATPDFVAPIVPGGLPTSAVQNQFDVDNGNTTGPFTKPTSAAAAIAMASTNPTFNTTTITNPLNWTAQLTAPNPVAPGAYPIAGFTQLEFYQCYAAAADLSTIFSYLVFHYANPITNNILVGQGFAPIPSSWLSQIVTLVTTGSTSLGVGGSGSCAGFPGI